MTLTGAVYPIKSASAPPESASNLPESASNLQKSASNLLKSASEQTESAVFRGREGKGYKGRKYKEIKVQKVQTPPSSYALYYNGKKIICYLRVYRKALLHLVFLYIFHLTLLHNCAFCTTFARQKELTKKKKHVFNSP